MADLIDVLSNESKGNNQEIIRNYCPHREVIWRHSKVPDYSKVNKLFFEERTKQHLEGSLEQIVQNVVKRWEIEQHNLSDYTQWQTMDIEKLKVYMNGKGGYSAKDLCTVGPYNAMLGDDHLGYKATENDFLQAEDKFLKAMPRVYAWEVLQVFFRTTSNKFHLETLGLL